MYSTGLDTEVCPKPEARHSIVDLALLEELLQGLLHSVAAVISI